MIRNINSSEFRIFVIAIAASIMLHLFWISAVKIVTSHSNEGGVKFSKVSFLGPASVSGGLLEFKVAPKSASFLEKRYRQKIIKMPVSFVLSPGASYGRAEEKGAPAHPDDNAMARLIEEALGSSKSEPAYPADVE
ncbi:MAG: hypothetical protein Q8Q87_04715 [Candidatus Omnitrophota bacterium]|nr:hypothetical protein [Candidatus Omnitrophota bacterium]